MQRVHGGVCVRKRVCLCVRIRGSVGRGREAVREAEVEGGREASRTWGWRGRVRISNRRRIERKYEAREAREAASRSTSVSEQPTLAQ